MAQQEGKIKKYRRPLNINLGIIVFGVLFVYVIILVVMYLRAGHVVGYEVQTGSLSVDNIYKAFAIRDEQVMKVSSPGYINYYAREGTRVAVGDLVYVIDETGKLTESLSTDSSDNSLSKDSLNSLKNQIMGFSSGFKPEEFSSVYDFKYLMQGAMMQLGSYRDIEAFSADESRGSILNMERASQTGIVVYSVDGYEDMGPEFVNAGCFDNTDYERKALINNELVNPGDPAYKLSVSENWSLIIPVDANMAETLEEAEYVRVKFLRTQQYSWGEVFIHNNEDGIYAQLLFNNSMITFCTDRYVDIEIETEAKKGLKIPNSAIAEREFFLVPKDYVTKGGQQGSDGVYKEGFNEEGEAVLDFIPTPIYSEDEMDYFLDTAALEIGDYIVHPETGERYAISRRNTLTGVFNINKGYADFKEINILYQNEEYSVVESGTTYGLSVYDYIALDSSSVQENAIINE